MSTSSALGSSPYLLPRPQSLEDLIPPYQSDLDAIKSLYRFVLTECESDISATAAMQEVTARMIERGLPLETLSQMTGHLTASEGKWLRALLVLLAGRALGLASPQVDKVAAVVELIHVSTLIHDDIIDQSDMRRGHATHALVWGNRLAVLFGDYVYSRAIQLTTEVDNVEVMRVVARATNLLCRGEIRQQVGIGDLDLSEEAYMETIHHKTASLLSACIETMCVLAELPESARRLGQQTGLHLGHAFQIVDDLLDYCSDAAHLGKDILGDLSNSTITLPLVHLFRVSPESRALFDLPRGEVNAAELVERLHRAGSLDYCRQAAQREIVLAHECWEALRPFVRSKTAARRVSALIDFVATRDH